MLLTIYTFQRIFHLVLQRWIFWQRNHIEKRVHLRCNESQFPNYHPRVVFQLCSFRVCFCFRTLKITYIHAGLILVDFWSDKLENISFYKTWKSSVLLFVLGFHFIWVKWPSVQYSVITVNWLNQPICLLWCFWWRTQNK